MTNARTIAFLGLGNMGLPMAANLAAAGHSVRGYDPAPGAAAAAEGKGLRLVTSPGEAVNGADVVITMLPSGRHLLAAYDTDAGIIGTALAGTLLIDCSTIDIADARTAHELAAAAGLASLDAPVSGGVVGAAAGTLTFMVGGEDDTFAAAAPLFEIMGKRAVHCGTGGAGQAAKICNNMVLGISMLAVSEAFVLAESLGLDHQALFDVVSTSSGQCWSVSTNCPVPGPVPTSPANKDFQPGFATPLMLKDMRLAAAAATAGGVDISLGRQALAAYEELAVAHPDKDFSVVIEAVRERSAASRG